MPNTKPESAIPRVMLGNTRVTGKEQYYTPADLAERLMAEVNSLVPDLASRTVIEPAGGTGAFIEAGISKFVIRPAVNPPSWAQAVEAVAPVLALQT